MNLVALIEYGHHTLLKTIENFTEKEWQAERVCGHWSAKDVLGHLTTMEHLVEDGLISVTGKGSTPVLEQFVILGGNQYCEQQVTRRRADTIEATLAEYKEANAHIMELLSQVSEETLRQKGLLEWYGPIYDLEDFIVYTNYGHKCEHIAQYEVLRDRLKVATSARS
jgi:hypothetical protein